MHKKDRRISFKNLLISILLITFFGLLISGCLKKDKNSNKKATAPVVKKKKIELVKCPIDGLPVSIQESLKRPVFVMIENSYPSRPQAGIGQACLVVEGLAEGGITRLGLVFTHGNPKLIGPVRSARSHFVAFAYGFDPIFVHCGGSKDALQDIKKLGITDFDQFVLDEAFWREKGRKAPHNLFTSIARIMLVSKDNSFETDDVTYQGFEHKKDSLLIDRPEEAKLSIDYSTKPYEVTYEYNRERNTFYRFNGGKPHLDSLDDKQLEPANIVVIYARTFSMPGSDGVLDVRLLGEGKADYFIDGKKIEGTWRKFDEESQIIFRDMDGDVIKFNSGQIWVEIVKTTTPVIWESSDNK